MNLNDKLVFRISMVLTIVVCILVILLNRRLLSPPSDFPDFIYRLPLLHAIINGSCSLLLIASLSAIKAKKVALHKRLNLSAFFLSVVFLLSYVTYHFLVPETSYGGEGFLKYLYYSILITHIIGAAVVLPLILLSFWYGLQNQVEKHKKVVRFSYPIWLYVTTTGVIIYLMISPFYSF
jgi:putative membrane protein